jgi:hypothetical protein
VSQLDSPKGCTHLRRHVNWTDVDAGQEFGGLARRQNGELGGSVGQASRNHRHEGLTQHYERAQLMSRVRSPKWIVWGGNTYKNTSAHNQEGSLEEGKKSFMVLRQDETKRGELPQGSKSLHKGGLVFP